MQKTTILLVDDEQEMLDTYSRVLEQAGFEAITALGGNRGLELAKEKHPALILVDVKMPEMDGVETVNKLKQYPETSNIKVVFLSAFGDPDTLESATDHYIAKELGAIDFIKKGLPLDEFIKKIKEYTR